MSKSAAGWVAVLAGLCLTRTCNYLLFHTVVEIFTVVVAWSIFLLAWNTRRLLDNHYLLLVGIASLFVGSLDLLHALAYKGMGVFPDRNADLPTQLWIAGRYLQSVSLLVAPLYLRKRFNYKAGLCVFPILTSLLAGAILLGYFPRCYIEASGLTAFKIASEYTVILTFLAGLLFLYRRRAAFEDGIFRLLATSLVLIMAAELAFTLYVDVFGAFNMIGHLLRFAAFCLIYRAILVTGMVRPNAILFRNLAQSEDALRKVNEKLESAVADLRAGEERYRAFVDASSEGICRFEFDEPVPVAGGAGKQLALLLGAGRLAECNAVYARMHGCERPEELAGTPLSDLLSGSEPLLRSLIESGYRLTDADTADRDPAGAPRWISSSLTTLIDSGRLVRLWGVHLDITERKLADAALRASEEALRESEARYRRLVEMAPEAILVQQDGKIVYCNEAATRLYGAKTRAELVGTGMFDRVHPGDLPAVRDRVREAERGASLPLREARHLRLDGSELAVETTAGPVEWHGRRAMLVFARDIAQRKRAEARLRDAQKLESLGLLAGGVAHDFNNLLVGVIGNASLAQEMLSPHHPIADLLDRVLKSGEHAAHLTRQMLAYSGKGRFVVETLNLSTLIPDMIGLVRPSIPGKIALRLDLAQDLPPVAADRGQLQQVFMNLALNASEAIGSRDGLITVRTGVEAVDESYLQLHPETPARPGKYVFLEVRDTGCGMDDATQTKIFDPFFSTKFVGRGLGLAAVDGIVRGHKGAIIVDSAPGKGSRFTVFFPVAALSVKAEPAAIPGATPRGAGTVLVVDDELFVRETARRALEHNGYTALLADSGPAAIDACKRHPGEIALVVLDLSMPHMSGEETLPELRKIRPEIKIMVSSGYSESEVMKLFHGQRVSGFIQKPYTSQGLAEKARACLG